MILISIRPKSMGLKSINLKTLAAGVVVLGIAAFTSADWVAALDAPSDTNGGRYSFSKEPDGFVRLDSRTGEVALCGRKAVGLVCQAAPEDRAVWENEIARLRSENAALKKDLLSRGLPLPPGAMPEPLAQDDGPHNDLRLLPSDTEIGRAVALAGRVWHRLIEAVERAQRQILNKS